MLKTITTTENPFQTEKPENLGFSSKRLAQIPHFFQSYLDQEKIPGLAILIAKGEKIAHFSAQGFASTETNAKLQADSIFRIYSMTKPITSAGLMMLFDEGRFRLEEPVGKYMPELGEMQVWKDGSNLRWQTRGPTNPMRIRDLLTHSSGLTYGFMHMHPVDRLYRHAQIGERHLSLGETVGRLAGIPLLFDPGTAWNYSVSTDMCGRLIEILSGETLDGFFAERIFKPLGMSDTAFAVDAGKASRLTSNYERHPKKKAMRVIDSAAKSAYLRMPAFLSGGGGLVSTIGDYYRFCLMLSRGGELGGARLLSPATVDLMMRNHLPGGVTLSEFSFGSLFSENRLEGTGFGLGGSVVEDSAELMMPVSEGTFSWGGAASTYFWIDRHREIIGIMMTQFMPSDYFPLRPQLQQLVYGALIE